MRTRRYLQRLAASRAQIQRGLQPDEGPGGVGQSQRCWHFKCHRAPVSCHRPKLLSATICQLSWLSLGSSGSTMADIKRSCGQRGGFEQRARRERTRAAPGGRASIYHVKKLLHNKSNLFVAGFRVLGSLSNAATTVKALIKSETHRVFFFAEQTPQGRLGTGLSCTPAGGSDTDDQTPI